MSRIVSYRNNGRINDTYCGSHDHWSQICRCDFIRSISPTRFCRSISSAWSRSLRIVRRISTLNPFDLPSDLYSRSTSFHARPRRPVDFVSRSINCPCIGTCTVVFNLLVRIAARSPHRCPPITAQSTLDLHCAVTRSAHHFHRSPPPLLRPRCAASCKSLHCCCPAIFAAGFRDPRCAAHSTHSARRDSIVVNAAEFVT
jgi:hypothetical protein